MPSKIPLSPGRGRVPARTPVGPPTTTTSNGPTPDSTTPTTKTTPKPSLIPRINQHSGVKAKTDSGLVRKKPVQKQMMVDLVQEDLGISPNLVRFGTPKVIQGVDIDISSPIHHAVDVNLNSRIKSGSKIPRGGCSSKSLQSTPSTRNSEIESAPIPIRKSRNEILDMQLEQEMRTFEAEDKAKSAKSSTAPPQTSKSLIESMPCANVDEAASDLKISEVGINILKSAITLEDSLSKTPFDSQPIVPVTVAAVDEQQHEVEKAPSVSPVRVCARSGVDRFYDEQVLHELIPMVDDIKENFESPVLTELPAVVGVSIQEITAPTQLHETISDPKLRDDPLVQLELQGASSICEEEQPACLVDSVTDISTIVSSPPTASVEELQLVCDNQQDKISIETFPISKETPTSSRKEITSCSSIKKSFSQILLEANSKTNQENLDVLEKEMVSFMHDEADRLCDANTEEEPNNNEDEKKLEKVSVHQVEEEQNYDSANDSSEFELENDEEPKTIVEELMVKESLQDTLSLSARNLRRELVCLQSGVNEMQMWGSITMYLASGVIIGVLAMENLRGFMETSFAPPEPHTAVGFWTSMYRVVFGEPAK